MPNINATPVSQSNGDIVLSHIGVANKVSQNFVLQSTYNKLEIRNGNSGTLTVTVNGTQITINPFSKKSYSGEFNQFSIISTIDSNEFTVNATYDNLDIYPRLDSITSSLK